MAAVTRQELSEELRSLEQRIDAKVGALEQRIDAKADALEHRIDAKLDAFEQRVSMEITQVSERLVEKMRDIQTETLRGFHRYADGNQMRIARVEAAESADSTRISSLEGRMLEVEKRLGIPGAPPASI